MIPMGCSSKVLVDCTTVWKQVAIGAIIGHKVVYSFLPNLHSFYSKQWFPPAFGFTHETCRYITILASLTHYFQTSFVAFPKEKKSKFYHKIFLERTVLSSFTVLQIRFKFARNDWKSQVLVINLMIVIV